MKHTKKNFRVLLTRARKIAQVYAKKFGESIPTIQLVQKVANVMQEYTQSGYGTFLIILFCFV